MNWAGPGQYRLLLALIVVVTHVSRFNLGHAAVYSFFSLSGYWVCSMWHAKYAACRRPYVTFLISRFWRLGPVFAICSVGAWLIAVPNDAPVIGPVASLAEAFSSIFILGYASLPIQPNVPAWSLDIEMQFYLVAPLMAICVVYGWRVTIVASLCLSVAACLATPSGLVLRYLIFFSAGAAAFAAQWHPSRSLALGSGALVSAALLVLAICPYRDILLGGAHPGPLFRFNEYLNIAVTGAILPWTIYTTQQQTPALDRMLGDLSYIIYLVHWPVLHLIDVASGSMATRLTHVAVAVAAITVLSWLIWKLVDVPSNRLRARWVAARVGQSKHADVSDAVAPFPTGAVLQAAAPRRVEGEV
ncbi:acyltransferase family protein [Bradyrhizobium sp. CCBAU 51745]|uniref:acyltransferase family protein n=1 Tax=Bradyrhizobium sp. CCBAU 51745 TaxID=1325099 RepID=UPI002305444C|nr:acyltransferase [Bradyrhizobium sp. CCBAU 51745]